MKKTLSLLLFSTTLFANNDGYIPLSEFSKNQKLEYNFETLKTSSKKENSSNIIKVEDVEVKEKKQNKVIENEVKEVQTIKEKTVVKKSEPIELSVKEEKISYKNEILTKTDDSEIKAKKDFSQDFTVGIRLEYSPTDVKYSINNLGSISRSSKTFSPILFVESGKNILELDYFMTDNILETTWYKLKYERKVDDLKIGFAINRYEISVENIKSTEDYLSLEAEQTKKLDNFFVNYGAAVGKNNSVDAYEYFLSLGFKSSELFNSSYLFGYKSKTIKDDVLKITYSGPFIGVNTTF